MKYGHEYFVYIVTNPSRAVLYVGVTNNLSRRIMEHWTHGGDAASFAGRYYCYNLIYYEKYQYVNNAITREKEIKRWRRDKKVALIHTINPGWAFLNALVCDGWPPQ